MTNAEFNAARLQRIRDFDPDLADLVTNGDDDDGAGTFDGYLDPLSNTITFGQHPGTCTCGGFATPMHNLTAEEGPYRVLPDCDCSYDNVDRAEAIMDIVQTCLSHGQSPHSIRKHARSLESALARAQPILAEMAEYYPLIVEGGWPDYAKDITRLCGRAAEVLGEVAHE
jgi:hypothetical protein